MLPIVRHSGFLSFFLKSGESLLLNLLLLFVVKVKKKKGSKRL